MIRRTINFLINNKRLALLTIGVTLTVSTGGCSKPVVSGDSTVTVTNTQYNRITPLRLQAGCSVEGRPIKYLILGYGRDVIFMLATIHGSEPAGTALLEELAIYLQNNPSLLKDRKVILTPVANPDGYKRNQRTNVNKVDLNRNFLSNNRQNNTRNGYNALTEPESQAIANLIDLYRPARIISIHQPLNCIDYDGPGRELAQQISKQCNLPVKKLGSRPGSLGSYAGNILNIPIITVELPANASKLNNAEIFQKYGPALIAAINFCSKSDN